MSKKSIFSSFLILFLIILSILIYLNFFNSKKEITVIVRSVGERTEEKCVENLQNIFGKNNVYLIKNVTPLIKATKKAINLAIRKNAKWTLFVDADVFISKDETFLFIQKADEIVKNVDDKAFVFQALLFDKFPQEYRHAGVWLYRTEKMPLMKKYFNFCSAKLKPDDCLVSKVVENDEHSYGIEYKIGIHDFFQSSESIVKKYYLRAAKLETKTALWKKKWSELAKTDKDFYWALKGVELYQKHKGEDIIDDIGFFDDILKKSNLKFDKIDKLKDAEVEKNLDKYIKKSNSLNTLDDIQFYRSRLEKRNLI